jgi:hypothetical protein
MTPTDTKRRLQYLSIGQVVLAFALGRFASELHHYLQLLAFSTLLDLHVKHCRVSLL